MRFYGVALNLLRRTAYGAVALAALACTAQAADSGRTLRIGYQKYGTLVFEKTRGSLEKKLAPLGVTVTWTEFLGGPALLEAMGAESIDFGITGRYASHLCPGSRRAAGLCRRRAC